MEDKMVAEPTTAEERAAWPIFGGLPTVKEQIHRLIADVERLTVEIDERARLAEQREELEATLQAEVKVLTEHMALHDRACCNELTEEAS